VRPQPDPGGRGDGRPERSDRAAGSGWARSPLGQRDFRLFFFGNVISSSGTWLQNVAQGVLVLQLTGRSRDVGAVQALTFLPILVLALYGGRLADRFDRRGLLIWSQVVAAAATGVLALLAAFHRAGLLAIGAVALVLGVQFAAAIPAGQAFVPSLVPAEQLGPAIGLNSVTYNLARALGPLLATVAVALLGFGLAFGLNSLSFLALAVAIVAIPRKPQPKPTRGGSIAEGLRYAWRNRRIRVLLGVTTAISFATDPVYTLSPAFAHDVFHRATSDAGLLVSAFGVGAILAAAATSRLLRKRASERRVVGMASLVVMAGGLAAMELSSSLPAAVVGLLIGGVGYLLTVTTWTTGIQEEVSDELRGRVMAIWTLCFLGSRPLAAVADGSLADLLSPRASGLIMLIPVALAGAWLLVWSTQEAGRGAGLPEGRG
jgi:MFS family permease